jgi:hypothetical protein
MGEKEIFWIPKMEDIHGVEPVLRLDRLIQFCECWGVCGREN